MTSHSRGAKRPELYNYDTLHRK